MYNMLIIQGKGSDYLITVADDTVWGLANMLFFSKINTAAWTEELQR